MELVEKLSEVEVEAFIRCQRGLDEFEVNFKKGMAFLLEIYQKRLWRENFKSFEDFCLKTRGWGKSHAYRFLEAAKFAADRPALKATNERQIRAKIETHATPSLSPSNGVVFPPMGEKTQGPAMDESEFVPIKEPEIIEAQRVDEVGFPIPDSMVHIWDAAEAAGKALQKKASNLYTDIRDAFMRGDEYLIGITNGLEIDMKKVFTELGRIKPYAICTGCDGDRKIGLLPCNVCRGRGYLDKHQWAIVPEALKKSRA